MIAETVFYSDEHLSQADRANIIQQLTEDKLNHTEETVNQFCKQYADKHLERNTALASWSNRGGF